MSRSVRMCVRWIDATTGQLPAGAEHTPSIPYPMPLGWLARSPVRIDLTAHSVPCQSWGRAVGGAQLYISRLRGHCLERLTDLELARAQPRANPYPALHEARCRGRRERTAATSPFTSMAIMDA